MRHLSSFYIFWLAVLLACNNAPWSVAQTAVHPPPIAANEALQRLPLVNESGGPQGGQIAPQAGQVAPQTGAPVLAAPQAISSVPLPEGDLPAPDTAPSPPETPAAPFHKQTAEEVVEAEADGSAGSGEELTDIEPEPVYSWYDIHYWFPPKIWEASIELGVSGAEGNSNTLNTHVGANAKRTTDVQILELDLTYTNNTSNSIETANQGLFTSRYDWLVPESAASLFINSSLEFDRFRAFDLRWAVNLGLGFSVIRNERTTLAGRFGSGVSQEVGGPDEQYVPEATFGLDFSHQINKQQKVAIKVDYFPDWQNYGSFRVNTDAGWEILLSEPMNLSLKLALLDRYDSTPNGAELNDLNYSLLLLWKL